MAEDVLLVNLGVLRSLQAELAGLGIGMRANDPTTTLIPVGVAMMSSDVAAGVLRGGA